MFRSCSTIAAGLTTFALSVAGCGDDGSSPFDSQGASTGGGSQVSAASASGGMQTSDATATGSGSAAASSDGADSTGGGDGVLLDVGAPPGGFGSCECELIYLWVADSVAGTVSKINTRTLVEEGRYITRPDGSGNPSRTSVNLSGDVAVANRYGGLTKFFADTDDCIESNGMPGIQTSTGKNDVLPWDQEECRAWYTDFPASNQRPVAWTGATTKPGSCDATPASVWTVTSATEGLPGLGGPGGVIAYLVNGESGDIEETVPVPGFPGDAFGAYGGAVDGAGNLYFSPLGGFGAALLARVDHDTLETDLWEIPPDVLPYGITVDHTGRVWLASNFGSLAGRFDPATETWAVVPGIGGGSGLAEGPDDLMYISQGNNVVPVHIDDLTTGPTWTNQEGVKGISFDADGFLWAVTQRDDKDPGSQAAAYKIDVDTMTTDGVYTELDDPYTYSDMTGNALGSVACNPEG